MASKAKPSMLGWGMARNAGEKLEGRQAQLERQMQEAMGETPRKRRGGSVSQRLGVKQ